MSESANSMSGIPANAELELLSEVLQTCKAIGFEKTLVVLKNSRVDYSQPLQHPSVQLVLNTVSAHLNVPKEQIVKPDVQERSDEERFARAFAVYYLKNSANLTVTRISRLFGGISRATVWRLETQIANLSPKSKVDGPMYAQKQLMDLHVADYFQKQPKQ